LILTFRHFLFEIFYSKIKKKMSESTISCSEFKFPELTDEKPQIYHFEKLVAYVKFLHAFYRERFGRVVPCFRDFTLGMSLLGESQGKKIEQKKTTVLAFYKWLREQVGHVKNLEDCSKFTLLFISHKADEEKINIKTDVESEHIEEMAKLLFKNIENERALRKKK
jgi:hypothetical protein